jgi:ribose transport system permease protein
MLLGGHLVLTYTRFGRYGLFVLGVLNNGLDHVNIDSFLKILIRGVILLAALVINVYAQRWRDRAVE